jgi:hypothetical protein
VHEEPKDVVCRRVASSTYGAVPHLPEEGASRADLEPGNLLVDAGGSELLLHVTRPLAREDDWSVLQPSSRTGRSPNPVSGGGDGSLVG